MKKLHFIKIERPPTRNMGVRDYIGEDDMESICELKKIPPSFLGLLFHWNRACEGYYFIPTHIEED